jgi:hypothetical protein
MGQMPEFKAVTRGDVAHRCSAMIRVDRLLLRGEGRILEMRTAAAARSWQFMIRRRRRAADTSICRDLIALPHLLCGHLLALCRRARYAHS